jgi:sRNA-binding protein
MAVLFQHPLQSTSAVKLGIREDVLAARGGATSAGKVSAALRWYVSWPEYQRRLVHGAWRVDLNGKPAGIVSQEDEAHARAWGRCPWGIS